MPQYAGVRVVLPHLAIVNDHDMLRASIDKLIVPTEKSWHKINGVMNEDLHHCFHIKTITVKKTKQKQRKKEKKKDPEERTPSEHREISERERPRRFA